MVDVPDITEALIDALETIYPDRLPKLSVSSEDIARLQGQQDVVERLRIEHSRYLDESA
jgi:hypothetical protein